MPTTSVAPACATGPVASSTNIPNAATGARRRPGPAYPRSDSRAGRYAFVHAPHYARRQRPDVVTLSGIHLALSAAPGALGKHGVEVGTKSAVAGL
jgi:hypothetical protein